MTPGDGNAWYLQYNQLDPVSGGVPMSRFRPGVLPSLLVVGLLPLLLWLGFWQLQRADEKRVLLAVEQARRLAGLART